MPLPTRPLRLATLFTLVACTTSPTITDAPPAAERVDAAIVPSTYTAIGLPNLPGGAGGTVPGQWAEGVGINSAGKVAGVGDWISTCTGSGGGRVRATLAAIWTPSTTTVPRIIGLDHPDIDLSRCDIYSSMAFDINDADAVVGAMQSGADWYGFFWTGGRMTRIGGPDSRAYGINNRNLVVGRYYPSVVTGAWRAFLWTETGGLVDIHPNGWHASQALDINDAGEIVGLGIPVAGRPWEVVRWSSARVFSTLRQPSRAMMLYGLAGSGGVPAAGMNSLGVIASAFPSGPFHKWWLATTSGPVITQPDDPAVATDVNLRGRAVGYALRTSATRVDTVAATTLGGATMLLSGTSPSQARAVNNCGSIAGAVALGGTSATSRARAVVWRKGSCD